MKSSTKAFRWIIEIFRRHNVTFQVSGGLAATAYGSSRPVRDFDFDITNDGFEKILPELKSYIVSGPQRHKSNAFENFLLKLKYKKQSIDIAGSDDAKIYDAKKQLWFKDSTDFSQCEIKDIYGISVPVISPKDLLAYKQKSPRPEDLMDIVAIEKYLNSFH